MAKTIPINQLKPGMVILQITRQDGPVKIRKSGLVTSDAMVHGLKEMGVMELAIDPDQTVELDDTPKDRQSLSDTQKLFASGNSPQHEQAVTDQFNRSLFMPSIQSLPAPWQYYGRRAGFLSLMLLSGFAIGWLLATSPKWWLQPAPSADRVGTPSQTSQSFSEPDPVTASEADKNTSPVSSTTPEQKTQPQTSATESQTVADTTNQAPDPAKGSERLIPEAEKQAGNQPDKISPELLRKFEQAVSAIESEDHPVTKPESSLPDDEVVMVHELPAWALTELPSMSFSAHMYASNPEDRWVNVNGQELGEGDAINDDLRIVRIEPQHVVMAFRGQQFSMRALTDW
ncbi:General secretion pathway protein B [Saliniradius amylolyticus]|uniref:General secretion pathway protein B n=1 Tax=Saliniradius amylolyticus TaxID=2183582 RepID=A0A2S2E512_9ALTE|nr:general secretion pathway protein GspB [Saliniradius amylolyticus]AWL12746.1 General secretion pathway protein B [Saliniradius amylolyticus]